MRTFDRIDRLATPEELHQVLEILSDLDRIEEMFQDDSSIVKLDSAWAGAVAVDSSNESLLSDCLLKMRELKN
jgi:hypothetical protein